MVDVLMCRRWLEGLDDLDPWVNKQAGKLEDGMVK